MWKCHWGKMEGKVTIRGALVQIAATFAIAYLTALTGFLFAWPSYNVANFMSNDTVLSHPMSSLEVSLLGSLISVGAVAVTPFCGYLMNSLGRKYSAILLGLPYVLAWTLISSTTSVPLILSAMSIIGGGTAGQAISSIYISEISQTAIRGALTSSVMYVYSLGLLLSYIIGGYLEYHQVVYIQLSMAVLYILMVSLLKESPVYLVQRGREKEAARSIAFYRQLEESSKEVEVEIAKIKLQLDPRLEKILEGDDDINVTKDLIENPQTVEKPPSEWQFLKKSQSSIRALIMTLTIMSLSILMGNIALQVYAETLFREAVPSMEPNQCSIYLAIDVLSAGLLCALLVDKFGRKPLMIITSTCSGICLLLLGLQMQYHFAPHWVTALLIYTYGFVFNVGAAVIPFVLPAEVFLPEVRGLCSSLTMTCGWVMNFVTVVIFTPVVEQLGLGPLFYGFAVVCFTGAAYSQFFQPETKGMSVEAIQLLFLKKPKRRVNVQNA